MICWPDGTPYLKRRSLGPFWLPFRLYLHRILKRDFGRAPHCHPSWFITFILRGGYVEALYDERGAFLGTVIRRFGITFRRATHIHRIVAVADNTWTLSLWGPRSRVWGFYPAPGQFVPWHEYERNIK